MKDDPHLSMSLDVIRDCVVANGAVVAANSDRLDYPRDVQSYRYVWPRDAAFMCVAARRAGIRDFQEGFFRWLLHRAEGLRVSSRYRIPAWTGGVVAMPWETRWASIGTVTLNLPRLGYRAERNDERLFLSLPRRWNLPRRRKHRRRTLSRNCWLTGMRVPFPSLR